MWIDFFFFFQIPADMSENIPLDLNMGVKKKSNLRPTAIFCIFFGEALFLKLVFVCAKFSAG